MVGGMGSWGDSTDGLVVLPDGRRVRGRGLRSGPPMEDAVPELGIYLTGRRYAASAWPSVWIQWPDFGVPRHRSEALAVLRHAYRRAAEQRVEIACGAGVGRTGTAIALLARMAGVPAAEAVGWARTHYRARAAETPWQRRFVVTADLDG